MEKKKGFMSFVKKLINNEESVLNNDNSESEIAAELELDKSIDPDKPFYAMLLINSYLQFIFVYERVTHKDEANNSVSEQIPEAIEELAMIVKDFESTLKLTELQIDQLDDSINLIEQAMDSYFSFKEQVETIEEKLIVLAPMAYGEKYQIDGLVRLGELFNPESQDRYMQSIPKIVSRIEFVNQTIHKLEANELLQESVVEEINKWFKTAINFKNVVDSDISTVKEVLLDVRTKS